MRKPPTDILLDVDSLDADGHGRASHNNRVVKIKAALPGEAVTARILRKRKGLLLAEALEVSSAHEHRRRAPCGHFPRCGGCVLQHLDYAEQLAFKQRQLTDALAEQGVAPAQLQAPVSGPRLGYRRKARLGVKQLSSGVVVGFRESFSARVGRMQSCLTLAAPFGDAIADYAELIQSLDIADQIPQLELAAGDHQSQIIVRHLRELEAPDRERLAQFELASGSVVLLQSAGPDSVVTLAGNAPPLLDYGLPQFGLSLQFAANEFTQVNAWMNQRLASDLAAHAQGLGVTAAVDLFCGIGNFSLPLARRGIDVLGVEASEAAVDRATSNAQRNGLASRARFQAADLYEAGAPSALPQAPLLILDPPRSGAGPNLSSWLHAGVQAVLYVSCNPLTFASDAKILGDAGLRLQSVGIYDMFPQTSHVETLGVFVR
ncbi:MAG: 23S rRNA (uracil(1939)-C(5))-methyltransferase RlmD [Pseudomonadales bacterium]